jgi:hypothetical protein
MRAFDLAWSILKQYTPPSGAERMPRPHPYGPKAVVPPQYMGRTDLDPERLRREGALLDLHRRLLAEAPIRTHGPLPPNRQIPTTPIDTVYAMGVELTRRRKHAGKNMMDVHQPRIYRRHVARPYYTAEHAPRYEAMYYDSPDYLFDDAPTGGR